MAYHRYLFVLSILGIALSPAFAFSADFGFIVFGGSGGAGASGGDISSGSCGGAAGSIGGAGGNALGNSGGGGGGGQGGHIDGTIVTSYLAGGNSTDGNSGGNGGGTGGGTGGGVDDSGGDATAPGAGGGGAGMLSNSAGDPTAGGNGNQGGGGGGGGGGYSGHSSTDLSSSGGGASTYEAIMQNTDYGKVSVEGGHGGEGGTSVSENKGFRGGGGGAGGGAKATSAASLLVNGNLDVLGGNGGHGGGGGGGGNADEGGGGAGGAGGGAELDAAGSTVKVRGYLTVASGENGAAGQSLGSGTGGAGGDGGDAVLIVGTLSASNITLTKNGGALVTRISTLDMTDNDTTLKLDNTAAGDGEATGTGGVNLGNLTFANRHSLSVTQSNGGTMTFAGSLYVAGSGNSLNTPIQYDAAGAGKSLNFNLAGLAANDIALNLTGAQGIEIDNNTAINLSGASDIGLGERATFLNGDIAGTFNASQLGDRSVAESTGITKTYLVSASAAQLSGFVKKIASTGDYTIPTAYAITAGSGTGESVELAVTGTLNVVGTGLIMTGNATNAATVTAGTLVADSLTLNGANAMAAIGVYDVTTADSALALTNTTPANVVISALNLGGGRTLTANSGGAAIISRLNVLGANATYEGNLNANNMTLNFNVADVAAGNTMLTVDGNADLANAAIEIDPITPLSRLHANETFNLIAAASRLDDGGFGGTQQQDSFNNKYEIASTATRLVVTLVDQRTFNEIITDQFGGSGLGNENLDSGAGYLDELSQSGAIPVDLAKQLDNAFRDAIAPGGVTGSRSLQQFFGAYSAYGNQALSDDTARFRKRWQGQNRSFFDTRLFADLLPGTADAGFASESGLASPVYCPRDRIACGQSRIWAGGFGSWTRQDGKSNLSGYKYDSQGAVLGYEYAIGNLYLGFAAAYSAGDLKVDDLFYKNEADVLNLALYGAYVHDSGLYAGGGFGYGHAWNDYKVDSVAVPGGVKKAKHGSDAFTANLELGYIVRLPQDFNLIPSVGIEYTCLKNGSWTESVNHPALVANRFHSGHDNGVDIPLGLRFNKMFRFGPDGGFVVPEVRAACVYSASKSRPSIAAGFAGAPGGPKMVGVDPGRSHWRIGAGVSGRINSRVDFRLDYDFETRSGFKGHNLNASLGLSF